MGKIYILFNHQNASKSIPLPSLAHIGQSPPPPRTRLPPMWPVFQSQKGNHANVNLAGGVEFVVVVVIFLAARGFSVLVLLFSPPLKILTFLGEK